MRIPIFDIPLTMASPPKITIARPLIPFATKRKRFKIALGGRGSSKSMTIADLCLWDAEENGIKTLCCREYQSSIEDSVLSLLESEVNRLEFQDFECQKNTIKYNGVEMFKFKGLARNPTSIQSFHSFGRAWVEEAQTLSNASLRALTPTIREDDSEIWMSANPRSMADPFSQRFLKPFEKELRRDGFYEDDLHLIVWINYTDNPFFPQVLEDDRAYDEKHLSKAEYNHIWLGETYDEVLGSIIPVEWFDAAIDAHLKLGFKPQGAKFCAFDPSDQHGDPKGFAYRHGSVYLDICDYEKGDVNTSLDWGMERALGHQTDHFTWDIGGMGTGLKRQVADRMKGVQCEYHLFNGAEAAENPDKIYEPIDGEDPHKRKTNKETFVNRRAQRYIKLADRFERTYHAIERHEAGVVPFNMNPDDLISLSSDIKQIDQVRSEVCRIPKKPNNNGRKQIMTKLEMSKKPYQLPSPNMADCMMMNEFMPEKIVVARPLRETGWG